MLKRVVEIGVNFIDTADSYGPDVSERLIGEALDPYAKGVIVATKGGLTRQGPDKWLPVGRPEYLQQQVEMSLRCGRLCESHNLAFIPWFPVASGKLAQPGGPLDTAAKKHTATVSQLSLAWLLHRSKVILPIPGTTSIPHLEENVAAGGVKLDDAEWREIEQAAK